MKRCKLQTKVQTSRKGRECAKDCSKINPTYLWKAAEGKKSHKRKEHALYKEAIFSDDWYNMIPQQKRNSLVWLSWPMVKKKQPDQTMSQQYCQTVRTHTELNGQPIVRAFWKESTSQRAGALKKNVLVCSQLTFGSNIYRWLMRTVNSHCCIACVFVVLSRRTGCDPQLHCNLRFFDALIMALLDNKRCKTSSVSLNKDQLAL